MVLLGEGSILKESDGPLAMLVTSFVCASIWGEGRFLVWRSTRLPGQDPCGRPRMFPRPTLKRVGLVTGDASPGHALAPGPGPVEGTVWSTLDVFFRLLPPASLLREPRMCQWYAFTSPPPVQHGGSGAGHMGPRGVTLEPQENQCHPGRDDCGEAEIYPSTAVTVTAVTVSTDAYAHRRAASRAYQATARH